MSQKHEITGTIKCTRSEDGECACCKGRPHAYVRWLELEPFETDWPEHFGRDVKVWLKTLFDFEAMEGQKLKITVEVVDENGTEDAEEKA